ncbi:MAG: 4Fe-4S binding protein [Solirubrobacterales bacterium]
MRIEETIKDLAGNLGADLCGIAPVERFDDAPAGFRPRDVFPQAKSAVVVARRVPEGPFHAVGAIPYTTTCNMILMEVTQMVVSLCSAIERRATVQAVPVPSEPYEYWDAENCEGKGLLSLKHAGWLAGLGVITANSLLTNELYGNRICLGALLLDAELAGDEIAGRNYNCDRCRRCVDACPVHAIDRGVVNQKLCRKNCGGRTAKGDLLYVCNTCRRVCPNGGGLPRREEN